MMRSSLRVALLTLLCLVAGPGTGLAVSADASPAANNVAYVRAAHLSPDTAGVDVYLTAFTGKTTTLWLSSVGYGDVSAYRPLASGLYAVSMRPHGAPASTPAALSWTLNAEAGAAYTAAAVGMHSALHGIVLRDELTATAGHARVRVVQASSQAGRLDVVADGTRIADDTAFATTTPYSLVPEGAWSVDATSVTNPKLTTTKRVTLASNSVVTLVVLDVAHGGMTVRTILDAAAATSMPAGSVNTGGGGTAHRVGGLTWFSVLPVGLAAGLGLALAGGLRTVRRRRLG